MGHDGGFRRHECRAKPAFFNFFPFVTRRILAPFTSSEQRARRLKQSPGRNGPATVPQGAPRLRSSFGSMQQLWGEAAQSIGALRANLAYALKLLSEMLRLGRTGLFVGSAKHQSSPVARIAVG